MDKKSAKKLIAEHVSKHGGLSLSEGTLRAVDLFDAVEFLLPRNMACEGQRLRGKEAVEFGLEDFLQDTVYPYLDELTPEGYYCGSTEGDGAALGFWQSEPEQDAFGESMADGETTKACPNCGEHTLEMIEECEANKGERKTSWSCSADCTTDIWYRYQFKR